MVTQEAPVKSDAEKQALNKRLESIAWALFLIMIGGLALIPKQLVPEGLWLLGAGIIMLGLNWLRFLNGIKLSNGTIVLGILALLSGLGNLFGVELPLLPILLILLGLHTLLKLIFEKE